MGLPKTYRSASIFSRGSSYDVQKPPSDHDPTSNLLNYEDIDTTTKKAGGQIGGLFGGIASLFGFGNLGDLFSNPVGTIWSGVTDLFIKPLGAFAELVGGFLSSLHIPILDPSKILNLPGLFTDVVSGFAGMFNAWFGGSSASGTPAEVVATVESIRVLTKDGYTLQTFTSSNPTWAVPPDLAAAEVAWAGVIGGGGKGSSGQFVTGSGSNIVIGFGGAGGVDGGYFLTPFDPSTLGATLAVVIGAAATTNGANGGTTSIGSLASSTPGTSGIATPEGYQASTSKPGSGGAGGEGWSVVGNPGPTTDGGRGESSATASGGAGGNGAAGSAGVLGATGTVPLAGGSGGGGGSGRTGFGVSGYAGGNGGYPGGGSGGGGGVGSTGGGGSGGSSGAAAAGFAFLIWK